MRDLWLHIIIVILIIISSVHGGSDESQKCTENDTRKIYDGCTLDYRQMALWCDLTKLTCIPRPEEVKSYAPCDRAIYLFMNNSCLDHIDPAVLQQYISLRWVDFSDNSLTSIPVNSFSKAGKLRHLDASMNNISDFSSEAFPAHNHLRSLSLSKNVISHLTPGAFERMVELRTINLDGNQITTFNVGWFPKRSRLSVLNMRNNLLRSGFEPNPGQFKVLKVIHLGGNKIQSLYRKNFSHLTDLHEIYLNDNKISTIEADTFNEATQLTTINLKNNQLESLPRGLFNKLCSLRELVLTGNQLATLYPDWFANPMRHSLRTATPIMLSLTHNKWSCDCRMLPYWKLLQHLKTESSEHASTMDVECSFPEAFRGSNLKSMSKKQLLSSGSCSGFAAENKIALPKKRKRSVEELFFNEDDAESIMEDIVAYGKIAGKCAELAPDRPEKDGIVTSLFVDEDGSKMKLTSEETFPNSGSVVIVTFSLNASFALIAAVAVALFTL